MQPRKRHVLLLWLLVCSGMSEAIEPISTSIAVGMAAALTGLLASYQNILYYFHECCRPEWIHFNKTGKFNLYLCLSVFYTSLSTLMAVGSFCFNVSLTLRLCHRMLQTNVSKLCNVAYMQL